MTTTTEAELPRRCLVDTNVLLRLAQAPETYPRQHKAVRRLLASGSHLFIAFQNVAEFWNVSTRPLDLNGRGLSTSQTRELVSDLERQFEIVTEDREVFSCWIKLVADFGVSGRQVHDARLVAHRVVRGIPGLLTSNTKDFLRYPQIQLLDPEQIA